MNLPSTNSRSMVFRFIIIILTSIGISYGQENQLTGKIIDAETNEVLSFAHIVLKSKQIGVVANAGGMFHFPISITDSDSIEISYVGYETLTLPIPQTSTDLVIKLQVLPNLLDEVIINPITNAFDVLERTVFKYQGNRRKDPHIARGYLSEKVQKGREKILLFESVGYNVFCGDSSKFTPLANQNFYPDLTRIYYDDQWNNLGSHKSKPLLGNYTIPNFQMYVENFGLLSIVNYKDYKVSFDESDVGEGSYLLNFSGNGEKGVITISDDFQVKSIFYDRTKKIWSSIFNKRISGEVEINYMYFGEIPFASQVWISYLNGNIRHTINYKNLLQKLDRFDVSNDEIGSLQRYTRNPKIHYNSEEWNQYNIPFDSDFSEDSIFIDQTKSYEGKSYLEGKEFDGFAVEIISALSKLF